MKKNQEKQKSESEEWLDDHGRRIWKILAISIIVVFAVFIILGIMKSHYIRSSFVKPTQEQINYAEKVASEKLQSTGVNASSFEFKASDRMRKINDDGTTVMQVSFFNNSTTHMYLVDINSGEILMHSQTDIYKQLDTEHKAPPHDGFPPFDMNSGFFWHDTEKGKK
jgi:hypothetical protein